MSERNLLLLYIQQKRMRHNEKLRLNYELSITHLVRALFDGVS